jgi:hypothetical protein
MDFPLTRRLLSAAKGAPGSSTVEDARFESLSNFLHIWGRKAAKEFQINRQSRKLPRRTRTLGGTPLHFGQNCKFSLDTGESGMLNGSKA